MPSYVSSMLIKALSFYTFKAYAQPSSSSESITGEPENITYSDELLYIMLYLIKGAIKSFRNGDMDASKQQVWFILSAVATVYLDNRTKMERGIEKQLR